jgi:hypothetical protein
LSPLPAERMLVGTPVNSHRRQPSDIGPMALRWPSAGIVDTVVMCVVAAMST